MTLFEIEQEILSCIDTETGEIIDLERLNSLEIDRDRKIENIALWIKNLRADAEALKNQKQIFADRQKVAENKAESLKQYLKNYLSGQKFSTDRVEISFRKSTAVNITDPLQIPKEYLKYSDPTIDKAAIKKAITQGSAVGGAEIVESQNIQIK